MLIYWDFFFRRAVESQDAGSGYCWIMYKLTSKIFTADPVVGQVRRAFDLPVHLRHLQPPL
jgi:hypothetical protein